MTEPNLNWNEVKVLAVLADSTGEDYCHAFAYIASESKLDRKAVRRACRSLTRKGLARFERGLWTEDGEPAGSGYGVTKVGRTRAKSDPDCRQAREALGLA